MTTASIASPVIWQSRGPRAPLEDEVRKAQSASHERIRSFLQQDEDLARRFETLMAYQRRIRVSEYHLTNACNIRCKGCWFFEAGLDKETKEESDLGEIEAFVTRETANRKINTALVIGGEPALVPRRLSVFVKHMRRVSISTNGLKKLPLEGFEDVAIGVSVWGGGTLDDDLRGIKPSGAKFQGLFNTALNNYRNDRRAFFVFAVTESSLEHIEAVVRKVHDNGNNLIFNFYSDYASDEPIPPMCRQKLIDEMLRVRLLFPGTVVSHPYFIEAIVTGRSHWDSFGYHTCPSISRDHPAHATRLSNGNPVLPLFNTFSADMKSVTFCCTSGRCDGCRDSQAMGTWLLVNMHRFTSDIGQLRTWVELAESWWQQFCWSPYHRPAIADTCVEGA